MIAGARTRLHDQLKRLDALAGGALARRLARPRRPLPPDPRDVLVVRLWGLGNLTLLAPLLAAAGRDGRRLRLLTLERNAAFAASHLGPVGVLAVADPVSPRFLPSCLAVRRALASRAPDVVVDLEQFLRLPLVLVRSATDAPAVGLDTPGQGRAPLLDRPVAHDPTRHVADTFAALWRAANLPCASGPAALRIDPAARRRLADALPAGAGPLVIVHPGSGDHGPGRRWPPERFAALVEALSDGGARVLLTGTGSERRLVRRVRQLARGAGHDWCGRVAAGELPELLSLADLLVTNDTGPLHVADAVDTPAVALYGPNTPHRYGPRRPGSRALFADLPCSPCLDDRSMKRSACRHYACMEALSIGAVLGACCAVLEGATAERRRRPAAAHA